MNNNKGQEMKKIGVVYKPNSKKITSDFRSALNMCRSLGISYQTYQNLIRSNKPKTYFLTDKAKDNFFKLLNNGYIIEVSTDEVQNV